MNLGYISARVHGEWYTWPHCEGARPRLSDVSRLYLGYISRGRTARGQGLGSRMYLGYISAISQVHLGCTPAISQLCLGYSSATDRMHLGCISAMSERCLGYSSGASRLYLGCISARLQRERELRPLERLETDAAWLELA